MKVDARCTQELKRLMLKDGGLEISSEEAHEILSRLTFLLERFSIWVASEKAKGRVFEIDEPPPAL
jgi:hypothetical protein